MEIVGVVARVVAAVAALIRLAKWLRRLPWTAKARREAREEQAAEEHEREVALWFGLPVQEHLEREAARRRRLRKKSS